MELCAMGGVLLRTYLVHPVKSGEMEMILYRKYIRPMHCYPGQYYEPLKEPVEKEERWYPEERYEEIEKKYDYLNKGSFSDLVFDVKYEPYREGKLTGNRDETMPNRKKVIKGLNACARTDGKYCGHCPYTNEGDCVAMLSRDVLALLKEQEVRELTMDEWRKWKENQKRNPICKLWENDTSPMWVLKPEDVNEPALLMGKLKLFTGKPTFEQCKAVKWE